MNVQDAALLTATKYPGGARALGERMGKSNLADEINPKRTGAKLGLIDAVDMQILSQDFRILYAMAAQLDHLPPMPMPGVMLGDAPCAGRVAVVAQEFSALMQQLAVDLADNKITDNELARAGRKWGELVAAGQALMQQLAAMNAELRRLGAPA